MFEGESHDQLPDVRTCVRAFNNHHATLSYVRLRTLVAPISPQGER
jgi:hypothetical protein